MRTACVALAILASTVASAQNMWAQSMCERAMDLAIEAAKRGWNLVQKQGQPLAEKIVRSAPDTVKSLQDQVRLFSKQYGPTLNPRSLDDLKEKKELLLELWKIRYALDVAMLTDPQLLQNLTGIDARKLSQFKLDFGSTIARIRKINPDLVQGF